MDNLIFGGIVEDRLKDEDYPTPQGANELTGKPPIGNKLLFRIVRERSTLKIAHVFPLFIVQLACSGERPGCPTDKRVLPSGITLFELVFVNPNCRLAEQIVPRSAKPMLVNQRVTRIVASSSETVFSLGNSCSRLLAACYRQLIERAPHYGFTVLKFVCPQEQKICYSRSMSGPAVCGPRWSMFKVKSSASMRRNMISKSPNSAGLSSDLRIGGTESFCAFVQCSRE